MSKRSWVLALMFFATLVFATGLMASERSRGDSDFFFPVAPRAPLAPAGPDSPASSASCPDEECLHSLGVWTNCEYVEELVDFDGDGNPDPLDPGWCLGNQFSCGPNGIALEGEAMPFFFDQDLEDCAGIPVGAWVSFGPGLRLRNVGNIAANTKRLVVCNLSDTEDRPDPDHCDDAGVPAARCFEDPDGDGLCERPGIYYGYQLTGYCCNTSPDPVGKVDGGASFTTEVFPVNAPLQ